MNRAEGVHRTEQGNPGAGGSWTYVFMSLAANAMPAGRGTRVKDAEHKVGHSAQI